ncbi:MAG: copper resistance CopC family protein [Mycobacterium sp.]
MNRTLKGSLAVARVIAPTVLVAAGLSVAQAPIASAHVTVVSTTPAQGATVTSPPTQVKMLFSEPPTSPTLTVTGSDGKTYSLGATQASNAAISVSLHSTPLPSGVYTVTWALTAPDGDAQNGTWTFFYQPPIQPKH